MNEHAPFVAFWLFLAVAFGTYNLRDIPEEPPLPNINCPDGHKGYYYKSYSYTKYECQKIQNKFLNN